MTGIYYSICLPSSGSCGHGVLSGSLLLHILLGIGG